MSEEQKRSFTIWDVLKSTVKIFREHDTATLGAALCYYMIFSIAPVIIIVITLVGAVLGKHAVQGEIKDQIQDFLGNKGARQLEHLIASFYHPGKNFITTALATILLMVGATSVFGQIRKSLNTIWEVKSYTKKPMVEFIINRMFSFGMIICLSFILLVSLVVQAGITAFTDYLNATLSGASIWVIQILHHLLALVASTLLIAFVYKYLSDAKLKWRHVWEGAIFTAFLFVIGKHIISLYIGQSHLASTYGAIGTTVVILAWVYYSAQIVFFGAAFTSALALHRGYSLDPVGIETNKEAREKADEVNKEINLRKDNAV